MLEEQCIAAYMREISQLHNALEIFTASKRVIDAILCVGREFDEKRATRVDGWRVQTLAADLADNVDIILRKPVGRVQQPLSVLKFPTLQGSHPEDIAQRVRAILDDETVEPQRIPHEASTGIKVIYTAQKSKNTRYVRYQWSRSRQKRCILWNRGLH